MNSVNITRGVQKIKKQVVSNEAQIASINRYKKIKVPLITFVDDDGDPAIFTKLKPLSISKNVPFVTAIHGTSQALSTMDQLKELQNIYGWEIASHSNGHVDLTTLTEVNLNADLDAINASLEGDGFSINTLVYPYGNNNALIRRTASKYYKCALQTTGGVNDYPLKTFNLYRENLAVNDLAYHKAKVDEAVAKKGWLIFMTHVGQAAFDPTRMQLIADLIDYIKSLSVSIVTMKQGYDVLANIIEIGDTASMGCFTIDLEGNAQMVMQIKDKTGITATSIPSAFIQNCISSMTFSYADNSGFPDSGAGTLETYRLSMGDAYTYQIWSSYANNRVYKRRWNDTTKQWMAWSDVGGTNVAKLNAYVGTDLITAYDEGKVTIFPVNAAGASGFGEGYAGTVITYRINGNGWDRQEYRRHNTNEIWDRYVDSGGAWTAWLRRGSGAGTTAQRPTNAYVGYPYRDSTLGKTIVLRATPNVWEDMNGNLVV